MIIISDSSSLILLAKSNLLDKLSKRTKILIPKKVYEEVVEEGLKRNKIDAVKINNLIEKRKIQVKKVNKEKKFPITLDKGEKEALELYYQEKANNVIVDDKKALQICKIMKIPYLTVHIILTGLLKKKIINKNQAIKSLEILDKEGRYSSEIILRYYDIINKGRKK
jgi:predicted nucleic acid-binding protein